MTQPAIVNFGTCWSCISDLTMPAVMATGFQVVAEAIIRRWSTSPGQLIDDPDYGFNLTDLISDDLSPADVSQAQQAASAEAQKDERVLGCAVKLTLNNATGLLAVTASVTTAQGPFELVASVSAIGVSDLLVQP